MSHLPTFIFDSLLHRHCLLRGRRQSCDQFILSFHFQIVVIILLIDSGSRELSNGGLIVNFDHFDRYLSIAKCSGHFLATFTNFHF